MRAKMLGLMRERNLYLEKCRAMEQFGERIDWQGSNEDDNGLLAAIHEILYQQQDDGESMEDDMVGDDFIDTQQEIMNLDSQFGEPSSQSNPSMGRRQF